MTIVIPVGKIVLYSFCVGIMALILWLAFALFGMGILACWIYGSPTIHQWLGISQSMYYVYTIAICLISSIAILYADETHLITINWSTD